MTGVAGISNLPLSRDYILARIRPADRRPSSAECGLDLVPHDGPASAGCRV